MILLLTFAFALIFFKLGVAELGHFREEQNVGTLPYKNEWRIIKNDLFKSPMQYSYNNYHEYRYSAVAQNILDGEGWLILKVKNFGENMDYFHKGPVYFWLTAVTSKIIGFSNFSVRFWPALLGFTTIAMIYFLAKEIFDKKVGLLSVFILTTTFQFIHIDGARAVSLGTIFIFLVVLAVYLLFKQGRSQKFFYLAVFSIALAGLTRSVLMTIPLVIFFFVADFILVFKSVKFSDIMKKWLIGLAIIVAIVSPWVAAQQYYGRGKYISDVANFQIHLEFMNKALIVTDGLFDKFQYNLFIDERPSDLMFYPQVVFKGFFPWSMLVILAILYSSKIWWQEKNKKLLVLLFSIGAMVLFVYIKEQKWARYMVELYPFLSIIAAKLLVDFYELKGNRLLFFGMLATLASFYWVIVPFNISLPLALVVYGMLFLLISLVLFLKDPKPDFSRAFSILVLTHFGGIAIIKVL